MNASLDPEQWLRSLLFTAINITMQSLEVEALEANRELIADSVASMAGEMQALAGNDSDSESFKTLAV